MLKSTITCALFYIVSNTSVHSFPIRLLIRYRPKVIPLIVLLRLLKPHPSVYSCIRLGLLSYTGMCCSQFVTRPILILFLYGGYVVVVLSRAIQLWLYSTSFVRRLVCLFSVSFAQFIGPSTLNLTTRPRSVYRAS